MITIPNGSTPEAPPAEMAITAWSAVLTGSKARHSLKCSPKKGNVLTTEQANLLISEGLLSFQRRQMGWEPRLASVLEFLIMSRKLVDLAIDLNGEPWRCSTERYRYLMEAAGVLQWALQHHGMGNYTTHMLRRAVHPQQAEQHSELIGQEFMRKEAGERFKEAFDAAYHNQPIDVDVWEKLKAALERLGVPF